MTRSSGAWTTAEHPPKYPPITSGENLRRQLSATVADGGLDGLSRRIPYTVPDITDPI